MKNRNNNKEVQSYLKQEILLKVEPPTKLEDRLILHRRNHMERKNMKTE
jgi:hypothetical protein